jgi:hypothetical protein
MIRLRRDIGVADVELGAVDIDVDLGAVVFRPGQMFVATHFKALFVVWHRRCLPVRRQCRIVAEAALSIAVCYGVDLIRCGSQLRRFC